MRIESVFPLKWLNQFEKLIGENFIIIFRLSMLDLVEDGSTKEEVIQLAKALEEAGVTILNTGIGWHEARIPTIATSVPRAAFSNITAQIKEHVSIPVITSNRINTPTVVEEVLAAGKSRYGIDGTTISRRSISRPKAMDSQEEAINVCIACNQACLDHVFEQKVASCLVNPFACHETEMPKPKTSSPKSVVVVGAGMAGLVCAVTAAERGHHVELWEKSSEIGGQFNMAKRILAKESSTKHSNTTPISWSCMVSPSNSIIQQLWKL